MKDDWIAAASAATVKYWPAHAFKAIGTSSTRVAPPKLPGNALVQPEPRAAFAQLIDMEWTDAIRTLHPDDPNFTFWSYLRNRWPRDAGLRLDRMPLTPPLAPKLKAADVDRRVRGEADASDHAPMWIELDGRRDRQRKGVRR